MAEAKAAAAAAAPPAQAAAEKAQTDAELEKRKRKKRRKRKFILSLFLILLIIAGVIAAFYYTGVIKSLFELIGFEKPMAVMSGIEQEQRFQSWQKELEDWEFQLDKREQELEDEKKALSERETAVAQREENVKSFSAVLTETDEGRVAVLERLGEIYDKMDVKKAVATIEEMYTVDEMAIIIYYMSDETAAAVLAEMTPSVATQIVSMMIG
jgi:flagellar motility protein MotE (MotC chaperone)